MHPIGAMDGFQHDSSGLQGTKRSYSPSEDWADGNGKSLREDNIDGQWSCAKCGNMNFPNREFCNMRKCGAPKTADEPWVCPGCGNENHGNRLFCNMRKCQLARPGLRASNLQQHGVQLGPVVQPVQHQGKGPLMTGGKGAHNQPATSGGPPGSWTCACGNLNWPLRVVCNARNCGRPMPAHGKGAMAMAMPMAMPRAMPMSMPVTQGKGGGSGAANPEGSWSCLGCGNVNWPDRQSCNGKTCGQPRSAVDGGPPMGGHAEKGGRSAPKGGGGGGVPPGSWVCEVCQNVNYPNRTVCNKRDCGAPKPFL